MERMGVRRRLVFLQAVVLGARVIAEGSARRTGERRMGGGGNDIVQRGRDHGSSSSIGRDRLGMAVLLALGVLASQRRLSRLVGGKLLWLMLWWRRGFVELDGVSLVLATKGPNGHGDE